MQIIEPNVGRAEIVKALRSDGFSYKDGQYSYEHKETEAEILLRTAVIQRF
jgi:hypothetical protein